LPPFERPLPCLLCLLCLAAGASYQHAFGFIRQLAVLLRSALTAKTKDAYREVYCWQASGRAPSAAWCGKER
jgi:hypothetical protein